jgi:hypothetical protein
MSTEGDEEELGRRRTIPARLAVLVAEIILDAGAAENGLRR